MTASRRIWMLPLALVAVPLLGAKHGDGRVERRGTSPGNAGRPLTATLLQDGQILLGGGTNAGARLRRWPPDPGAPQGAVNLSRPRDGHSATLLPSGDVVVIGGGDGSVGPLPAEVVSGDLRRTDVVPSDVVVRRRGHSATLLSDGRVLVLGGEDEDARRSSELFGPRTTAGIVYDPSEGSFVAAPYRLARSRSGHSATLLPDGHILLIGGRGGANTGRSVELLDPVSGRSQLLPERLSSGRWNHTATLLPSGAVLVVGGVGENGQPRDDGELWNGGAFVTVGKILAQPRAGHAAVLAGGKLLAFGGTPDSGTDPVRVPIAERDGEDPAVTMVGPQGDAADARSLVRARFSEPVDPTSVNIDTFRLTRDGALVEAHVGSGEAGLYGFLVPRRQLLPGTYLASLRGARDWAGNSIEPATWTFRVPSPREPEEASSHPAGSGASETPSANTAPVVNAGPDLTVLRAGGISITASVTDDGLPSPPGAVTVTWTKVSGPGSVAFSPSASVVSPTVSVDRTGTYVLQITANDGALQASDTMTLRVRAEADFDGDGRGDLLWREVPASGFCAGSLPCIEMWLMNGAGTPFDKGPIVGGSLPAYNWRIQATVDMDGDGWADVLWRNETSGANTLWTMNGRTRLGGSALATQADLNLAIRGVADFDGDARGDILWRSETAATTSIWFSGTTQVAVSPTQPLGWSVAGTGDLNGDGKADILWRNPATGQVSVWLMNGAVRQAEELLPAVGATLVLAGVGDLNRDGRADLVWRDMASGEVVGWLMDGSGILSAGVIGALDLGWRVLRVLDFDGNGKSDVLLRNTTSGIAVVWLLDGLAKVGGASVGGFNQAGANWQVQGNALNWSFGTLPAPVISPAAGTFTSSKSISISASALATVRFTTATAPATPADPSEASSAYTGPFVIERHTNIKARAFAPGWAPSTTATAAINIQVATPQLALPAGAYAWDVPIQVISPTAGAVLHYTTNGVTPTEADPTIASGTLLRNPNATLKVKAWKGGCLESTVATATYSVAAGQARGTVLFVGASTGGVLSNLHDQAAHARLVARGFEVVVTNESVTKNEAGNKALVLLSSSLNSSLMLNADGTWKSGKEFETVAGVAIIAWKPEFYQALRMTGGGPADRGTVSGTQVSVVLPSSPLAAGLTGNATVSSAATYAWGAALQSDRSASLSVALAPNNPAPGAYAVFAYEAGARLNSYVDQNGVETPVFAKGPRVGLFAVGTYLTAAGWKLFDQGVEWAARRRGQALYVYHAYTPPSPPNSPEQMTSFDKKLLERLGSLGYGTASRRDVDVPTTNPDDGFGLVLIARDADVAGKFTGSQRPVVVWNHWIYDNMYLATSPHDVPTITSYAQMRDAVLHPLRAGLTGSAYLGIGLSGWGSAWPTSAATVVADVPGTSDPGLFGYEYLASLTGAPPNDKAPNRRVAFLSLDAPVSSDPVPSEAYWRLFDSAVRWAAASDRDGDGLPDVDEWAIGSNPLVADTNGDGILDGAAFSAGISVTNMDMDGDTLTNAQELARGTSPFNPDTDGDGCRDNVDLLPLDPTNPGCGLPGGDPSHHPTITLIDPALAPVSSFCTTNGATVACQ